MPASISLDRSMKYLQLFGRISELDLKSGALVQRIMGQVMVCSIKNVIVQTILHSELPSAMIT